MSIAGADALVEIGTEELPPRALRRLAAAFAEAVQMRLADSGIAFDTVRAFATPRRLAVRVAGLAERAPDRESLRRGPALAAAFDARGAPTAAARGFARACGVDVEALEWLETEQGRWLAYRRREPGASAAELLPAAVRAALERLPAPKRMRWGAGEIEFVRPVHWAVLLHGDRVLDTEILGLAAGRETRGHRFHHPEPIALPHAADYERLLTERGRVLPDFDARRARIRAAVAAEAERLGGAALLDDALLEEVTALVEWPVVLAGRFDPQFLRLPREVLIATLKDHQRYFPVQDAAGALLPSFITVANIDSREPHRVREGNERVVRPRLADAAFFWDSDRRRPLADHLEALGEVVWHDRLGSLLDKSVRVERLAERVAGGLGADAAIAARAAKLARCDLLTAMVGEFPSLQGVMGRYYALESGEPPAVAAAIEELYLPRFAGDRLPETSAGQAIALADRIDTLVGIFGVGEAPTGDKDPFGLRRAALGALRIVIERELDVDLAELVAAAAAFYGERIARDTDRRVLDFVLDRLRGYYLEAGLAGDAVEAVAARRPTRPLDFDRRLRAVERFRRLPEAAALAAANKRIANILRKAREAGERITATVDAGRLLEPAERALHEALEAVAVPPAAAARTDAHTVDYVAQLERLAGVAAPLDRFFDEVMVMAEDAAVRANRLALLERLHEQFLRVADVARLQSRQP